MKKVVIMTVLLFSVSITACAAKGKPSDKTAETVETTATTETEETTAVTETEETAAAAQSAESKDLAATEEAKAEIKETEGFPKEQALLSEDLFSYQIQIDDITYKFPMTFSEFTEKGWSFEGDASGVLEGSQYLSSQIWSKGELKCNTYISNNQEKGKPVSDCVVAGIVLSGNELKKASSSYTLPANIQFLTSTKEDVIAAFGEPTRQTTSGTSLTYYEKMYCEVRFGFDADYKLNDIAIQNMNN